MHSHIFYTNSLFPLEYLAIPMIEIEAIRYLQPKIKSNYTNVILHNSLEENKHLQLLRGSIVDSISTSQVQGVSMNLQPPWTVFLSFKYVFTHIWNILSIFLDKKRVKS